MGTSHPIYNSNNPTVYSHSICKAIKSMSNCPYEEDLLKFRNRQEFLSQLSIFQKRLKANRHQCGCIVNVLEINTIDKQQNTNHSICIDMKKICIEDQFMMIVKVEQLVWKVSQLSKQEQIQNTCGILYGKKKELSFMEGLYLLNGALYGFAQLRIAFKSEIRICEEMIGIDYQGNVKVWVNRTFYINQVEGYQQISTEKVLKNYYPTSKQSHIPDLVTSIFNVLSPHCKELTIFRDRFERQYQQSTYHIQLQELKEWRISLMKRFIQKYIQSDKEIQRLFVTKIIGNGLIMRFSEDNRRFRTKSKQFSGSGGFREKCLSEKKSLKRSQTSQQSQQRSSIFSKKNSQTVGNQILPYIMTQQKQKHSLWNRGLGQHLSRELENFGADKTNHSKGNTTDRKGTDQNLSQSIVNKVCKIQSTNKLNSSRQANQKSIRSLDQSPILSSRVSKNHNKSVSNQKTRKTSLGISLTPNIILTKRSIENKPQPQVPKPPRKSPISAVVFDSNETILKMVSHPVRPLQKIQSKMFATKQTKIIRYQRPAPENFQRRRNPSIKNRQGERRKVFQAKNSRNYKLQRVKSTENQHRQMLVCSQENRDENVLHYISKKPEDVGVISGQLGWSTSPKPRKIIILGKQAAAMSQKVFTSRQTTPNNGSQNLAPRPIISSRRDTPVPHKILPQRSMSHTRGRQLIPFYFGQRHSQFPKLGFYNRNFITNSRKLENVMESRINEESTCERFRQPKINILLQGQMGQKMQEGKIEASYETEKSAQLRQREHRGLDVNMSRVKQRHNQNYQQAQSNVDIECLALELKNVLQDKPCIQQSRQVPSEQLLCLQQDEKDKFSDKSRENEDFKSSIQNNKANFIRILNRNYNRDQEKDNGNLRLKLLEVRQIHSCGSEEAKKMEMVKQNRSERYGQDMGVQNVNLNPSEIGYNFSPSEPESTTNKKLPLQNPNNNIKINNVDNLAFDLKQKLHMGRKQITKKNYPISQVYRALQSSESNNLILDQALKNRQVLKSYYDFEIGQGGYHSRSISGGISISGEMIGRQRSCQGHDSTNYILEHQNCKVQSGRIIQDWLKSSIRKDKISAIRFKSAISQGMKEQGLQEISYAIFTQRNGIQTMIINQ